MKAFVNTICIGVFLFCYGFGFAQMDPATSSVDFDDSKLNLQPVLQYDLPPWRARRFNISIGSFFPINNTEIKVGSTQRDFGTVIDLEKDLGFDEFSYSFLIGGQWRISKRSRFELEYFYLNRESTHRLERTIEFGDHTYDVNAEIAAFFDVNMIRFFYGYAFVAKPTYEIGALIGSHLIFGDIGLRGSTEAGQVEISDNFNFTAPIPDIGLWTDIQLSKRFGLFANVNYLTVTIDTIKGSVFSTNVSLLYNVYSNFSIKAGYSSMKFDVEVEKDRLDGYFEWGYNGPTITLTYSFGGQVKI